MEILRDFREWALAVAKHWHGWVSGGILALALGITDRIRNGKPGKKLHWKLSKKLYLSVLLAGLLVSLFFTWRDQFRAAAEARKELQKLSEPEISARLNQIIIGDFPDINGCQIFLDISVRNSGSPSIAYAWTLSLDSPAVNRIEASFIQENYTILNEKGERYAVFHGNLRLEERTVSVPVQQGMLVGGWLRFVLANITPEQCRNAKKTLYFRDVTDREHSLSFKMPENENPPRISPSSGDSPFIFK